MIPPRNSLSTVWAAFRLGKNNACWSAGMCAASGSRSGVFPAFRAFQSISATVIPASVSSLTGLSEGVLGPALASRRQGAIELKVLADRPAAAEQRVGLLELVRLV